MEVKKASRKDVRIKMSLDGLAGSGKTFSALSIAKGLVAGDMERVVVLQTEPGRAQCYLDQFEGFSFLDLSPPFSPMRYVEAIECVEKLGAKVLIIDSLSDEWAGIGGALDMHNDAVSVVKNSFAAWKNVTPAHEAVFNKIMASQLHIIATFKKKVEYVLEKVERNGREIQQPKKVGTASVAREGTDYKFMLQFDIDLESHKARAVKDNLGIFDGIEPFQITDETGKLIRDWCLGTKKE